MAVPFKGTDSQRGQGVAVGRRLALAGAPPVPSAGTDFEAQRTLPLTLNRLEEHSGQIHRDWSAGLERQGFTPDDLRAVAALALAPAIAHVRGGGFDAYARALESAGQELARWGMPEPRAMAALEALLESSVRHVGGAPGDAATLVRLAFAGSLALTTGYAGARTTSWRSFGEQERQRLSRDLHDEIGHHLVVLKLYLGLIVTELAKARPSRIREKLDEATDLVSQAIQSVRRLILDLGPVALEGVGFLPAVKLYARQFGARTGVKVHVRDGGLPARLPATHETALYRLLQGALSNVLKHAGAQGVRVTVSAKEGDTIRMTIEDDGLGFDTAAPRQAFGLAAMRDRVASLGGRFRLESRPRAQGGARHGTRIEVELPLRNDASR